MVIVSKARCLVVHLAPEMLFLGVAVSGILVHFRRPYLWQTVIDYFFGCLALAVGLGLQRVARRKGDELEIWTVLGRRRVKAKQVFLGVTMARSSVNISLFLGKSMEPADPSIMVASYSAFGLRRPLRVARRIAETLDLPEPRLAPWLEPPSEELPGGRPHSKIETKNFRLWLKSHRTLLLLLVAIFLCYLLLVLTGVLTAYRN